MGSDPSSMRTRGYNRIGDGKLGSSGSGYVGVNRFMASVFHEGFATGSLNPLTPPEHLKIRWRKQCGRVL